MRTMREILTAEHRAGQHDQPEIGCPLCHPAYVTPLEAAAVALASGALALWWLSEPLARQFGGSLLVGLAVAVTCAVWGALVIHWERQA